jgi:bacteriocin biosynthesis cyclodehydratase domain-containing protein
MRPLLRPGTHVLSRGDGRLQVGLDPHRAVVLPDSAEVRAQLARLDGTPTGPVPSDVLDLLDEQDLLVDERALLPLLKAGRRGRGRYDAAALARRRGDEAPGVLDRRHGVTVDLRGFGHAAGSCLLDTLGDLVGAAGLRTGPAPGRRTIGVLAGVGEPERDLLDAWTRAGTPHVLLRLTEGRAVLGPFVDPGSTACLRCVDAHHADADPAWPLLVRQYATACVRDRDDGAPEPLDPALASLAASWTARDVVGFAEGRRPSTWSTTLVLDADLAALETRAWLRHPECACSW